MRFSALWLSLLVLAVTACSPLAGGRTPGTSVVPTEASETIAPIHEVPTLINEPIATDDELAEVVERAQADLSQRSAIDSAAVELIQADRVTWPDGSLGCPEPGQLYTQALVDGFKVVLGTNARTRIFIYTAGADGQPALCPSTDRDGGHDFVPPPGFET